MYNNRSINLSSNKEHMKNILETKLLLKSVKINSNLIDNRNKKRFNLHNKILLREKRLEKAKINSDLKIKRKAYDVRERHMNKDIRYIENKYKKLNPYFNNGFTQINNQEINKINYYGNYKRKYIDELKNKYYKNNYPIEGIHYVINDVDQLYDNFIDNNNEKLNYNNNENINLYLPIIENKYYKNQMEKYNLIIRITLILIII